MPASQSCDNSALRSLIRRLTVLMQDTIMSATFMYLERIFYSRLTFNNISIIIIIIASYSPIDELLTPTRGGASLFVIAPCLSNRFRPIFCCHPSILSVNALCFFHLSIVSTRSLYAFYGYLWSCPAPS